MSAASSNYYVVLNDPVKREWVVVADAATRGHEFVLPVHPFKSWKANKDLAQRIADLLSQDPDFPRSGNLVSEFQEWADGRS